VNHVQNASSVPGGTFVKRKELWETTMLQIGDVFLQERRSTRAPSIQDEVMGAFHWLANLKCRETFLQEHRAETLGVTKNRKVLLQEHCGKLSFAVRGELRILHLFSHLRRDFYQLAMYSPRI
jgi:hypothetical protein